MLSRENLEELAECLKVLTHPVRIRILEELKGRSICVSELCERIGASQSNISKHLTLLRYQGWLTLPTTKVGGFSVHRRD